MCILARLMPVAHYRDITPTNPIASNSVRNKLGTLGSNNIFGQARQLAASIRSWTLACLE